MLERRTATALLNRYGALSAPHVPLLYPPYRKFSIPQVAVINDLGPAVLNTFMHIYNYKPWFRPNANRFRSLKNSESLNNHLNWRHQQYQSQPGQTTLSFPTLKYAKRAKVIRHDLHVPGEVR